MIAYFQVLGQTVASEVGSMQALPLPPPQYLRG